MLQHLLPFTRRITERTVLWALVMGFGLVVVLLGLAGLVAVRDSHAIRQSSSGLVKEQLLIARLLYEVQAEEDALAHVLHLLVKSEDAASRAKVLDDLKEADRDVSRLAIEAAQTPQSGEWSRLAQAAQDFSKTARQALNYDGPLPKNVLESLFSSHDEVVKLIHDLILQSTRHLSEVNQEIEVQLDDLAEESKMLLGACLVFAALSAILTIRFVRHSIGRIRWQSDELNRVSWHMLQTQEDAARRFSHELHDELGQSLAAVRANLMRGNMQDLDSLRNDCLNLVDESIANVRELAQLLRPVILDDFGLDASLRWLAEKFAQRTRLEVKVDARCPGRFADETETHLFRIAQEALTNIARHAEAQSVTIQLLREGNMIRLSIRDDGKGLPQENSESPSSLGMVGMRARARQCGGELTVSSIEPHGVCVELSVPARSSQEPML
jgi:signal transduction histidine kinase